MNLHSMLSFALDSTKGITILLADQDFPFGVNTRDVRISGMVITLQLLMIVVELILEPFLQDFRQVWSFRVGMVGQDDGLTPCNSCQDFMLYD